MQTLTRCWAALAVLGAALVHLAVGAGAPLAPLIVLVTLSLAELAWAVCAFVLDRLPLARWALALLLTPVFGWALLLTVGVVSHGSLPWLPPALPMAVASLLSLVASAMLAARIRRSGTRTGVPGTNGKAGRFVAGIAAGSFIVAALVTPALAATQAGEHAVPHGESGSHH